ncbi:hypothetical protein FQN49_000914 [Arthroderma sp. PD_2]|nr:hypothetical protein FQN49_000914 [Arthroderma sp. PD_2]
MFREPETSLKAELWFDNIHDPYLALRLSTGASLFLTDHASDGAVVFQRQVEAVFLDVTKLLLPQNATSVRLKDLRFKHALVMTAAEDLSKTQLKVTSAAL